MLQNFLPELQGFLCFLLIHLLDGKTGVDNDPVPWSGFHQGDVHLADHPAEVHLGLVPFYVDDLTRNC